MKKLLSPYICKRENNSFSKIVLQEDRDYVISQLKDFAKSSGIGFDLKKLEAKLHDQIEDFDFNKVELSLEALNKIKGIILARLIYSLIYLFLSPVDKSKLVDEIIIAIKRLRISEDKEKDFFDWAYQLILSRGLIDNESAARHSMNSMFSSNNISSLDALMTKAYLESTKFIETKCFLSAVDMLISECKLGLTRSEAIAHIKKLGIIAVDTFTFDGMVGFNYRLYITNYKRKKLMTNEKKYIAFFMKTFFHEVGHSLIRATKGSKKSTPDAKATIPTGEIYYNLEGGYLFETFLWGHPGMKIYHDSYLPILNDSYRWNREAPFFQEEISKKGFHTVEINPARSGFLLSHRKRHYF